MIDAILCNARRRARNRGIQDCAHGLVDCLCDVQSRCGRSVSDSESNGVRGR
jgi:hypothetical protein